MKAAEAKTFCSTRMLQRFEASTIAKVNNFLIFITFLFFSTVNWWRKLKGGGECLTRTRPVSSAQSLTWFKQLNWLFDKEKEQLRQNVYRYPVWQL